MQEDSRRISINTNLPSYVTIFRNRKVGVSGARVTGTSQLLVECVLAKKFLIYLTTMV